ncbi:hypothetical protein G7046_g10004 [Stylonectria norvegica]|nr:hypothetical protein G7046_g10004 [Stylonectria norvegica]
MDYVALPKIEVFIQPSNIPFYRPSTHLSQLHAHLTGSISRRALHAVWLRKKQSGETDLDDPLVVMPEGKHDYNLETFFPLFGTYIYNLLTDEDSIRFTTTAVLTDFLNDGVCYLELRTTPRETPHLSAESYIALLLTTIAAFEARHPHLHTRLILSVDRRHTPLVAASTLSLALAPAPARRRGVRPLRRPDRETARGRRCLHVRVRAGASPRLGTHGALRRGGGECVAGGDGRVVGVAAASPRPCHLGGRVGAEGDCAKGVMFGVVLEL